MIGRKKVGREKGRGSRLRFGALLFFLFLFFSSFRTYADNINLNLTYGYQNTAKAGRLLPVRVDMENTMQETFTGFIHIYMAESGKSVYEYRYQSTIEAESSSTLSVTLSLGTGVNQLLVTAEGRDGTLYGSKRIGLDVTSADAELIIGLLSDAPDNLSYLNGANLNDGLLKTRTVTLDPLALPRDTAELDQLDMIVISDFDLSQIKQSEAEAISRFTEGGGTVLIGTGTRGLSALRPYYQSVLNGRLQFSEQQVDMGVGDRQTLLASPIYLERGRAAMLSDGLPMLSVRSEGAGLLAVAGYDFTQLTRFGTEHPEYIEQLFAAILGTSRLSELSVSAQEKSLRQYWSLEAMMNQSDVSKLPRLPLYVLVLGVYVLLVGPGIRYYVGHHGGMRFYRPLLWLLSVLFSVLIWTMGMGTRVSDSFFTYMQWRDYSESSMDETVFLNLRSPYREGHSLDIKTEYSVYPVLKGSDYTGDLSELLREREDVVETSIAYLRDRAELRVEKDEPFTAKYFELHNKIPRSGEGFSGEVSLFQGTLSGTVKNETESTLYDAALLLYGRLIKLGRLESGAELDLSGLNVETIPVGNSSWTASRITGGSGRELLRYYLDTELKGYFSQAKLVGFVYEEALGFTEDTKTESYGMTMVLSTLPLKTAEDGKVDVTVLERDPEVLSGDYWDNSISGLFPTVLNYHLGEEEDILSLRFENLLLPAAVREEDFHLLPFRGSMGLYNYQTGGYDSLDYHTEVLDQEGLRPYLNSENILRVRFAPREEDYSAFTRLYLPVPIVTEEEKVQKESGAVPVVVIGEENTPAEEADSEEELPGEEDV